MSLYTINILLTILMLGSAGGIAIVMIGRMKRKNEDLTIANHELDNFVYSVSHDLRAPLTSVKGLIRLSRLHAQKPQVLDYLTMIDQTLDKQDAFIREILDFSRNKRIQIEQTRVNVEQTVEQILASLSYLRKMVEVDVKMDLHQKEIISDPLRIRIIMQNLISNGLKYADRRKENSWLKIKLIGLKKSYQIIVEDNGIGIEKTYLQQIFDIFFVTDHSRRGFGLGLYITHQAVEKLGGNIKVQSEPGLGTKFVINLPVKDG